MKIVFFTITPLVFTFLLGVGAFAQDSQQAIHYEAHEIQVVEDSIMPTSSHYISALSVHIPESNARDIKKAWEKKIKKATKSKFAQQNSVSFLGKTLVEEVSQELLNVYSSYVQHGKDTKLIVAFELNNGFLSSSFMPNNYANAKSLLKSFAVGQYQASIKSILKQENKELNSLKRGMDKLFNKSKQLKTLIKKREASIPNLEKEIEENKKHVDMKTKEIGASTQSLAKYSGKLREQKDRELKKTERQRKQLQRTIKRMISNIARYETDIKKAKHDVSLNLSEQEVQKERVKKQQLVVENLKNVQSIVD